MRYAPDCLQDEVAQALHPCRVYSHEFVTASISKAGGKPWREQVETTMSYVRENLVRLFDESEAQVSNGVYFMMVPCDNFNAMILRAPSAATVVAPNLGFLAILRLFTALLFLAYGQRDKGDLNGLRSSSLRFLQLAEFACTARTPKVFVEPDPDTLFSFPELSFEQLRVVELPSSLQWLYVVAHEYSHLFLGHLEKGKWLDLRDGNGEGTGMRYFTPEQKMEFDADEYALKLLARDEELRRVLRQPLSILFSVMRLAEIGEALLEFRRGLMAGPERVRATSSVSSHPTADERFAHAIRSLEGEGGWHETTQEILAVVEATGRAVVEEAVRGSTR